jgi:hypothetical protein
MSEESDQDGSESSEDENDRPMLDDGRYAILSRDEEWALYRARQDKAYAAAYVAHTQELSDVVEECLLYRLVGVKPLRTLIASFAVPRTEVWLAFHRLQRVMRPLFITRGASRITRGIVDHPYSSLKKKDMIPMLLNDLTEDDLITIEAGISDWDPLGEACDPYTSHVWFVYKEGRKKIRLNPILEACNACRRFLWTEVRTVRENEDYQIDRKGLNWKRNLTSENCRLLCDNCVNCCGCTPVKASMYELWCGICATKKCSKHHFEKTKHTIDPRNLSSFYQCDDCLNTIVQGKQFNTILQQTNPITALAEYIQTNQTNHTKK